MAWSYISAGSVVHGANPTVPLPSSYATGDLLLLVLNGGNGASAPSGWTVIASSVGHFENTSVWYKIATSSESAPVVSSFTNLSVAAMVAYRGVNSLNITPSLSWGNSGKVISNSITTTNTDELVISIFSSTWVTGTWTPPTGVNVRLNVPGLSSTNLSFLLVDEDKTPAGATISRTIQYAPAYGVDAMVFSLYQSSTSTSSSNIFLMF